MLSKKLGIPQSDIDIAIGALLSEGYLQIKSLSAGDVCGKCPIKVLCGSSGYCPTNTSLIIYTLTEKGRKRLCKTELEQ
jgi:Na+-transporting NADH:ubiquinone oxidoreductase subunit NqrF